MIYNEFKKELIDELEMKKDITVVKNRFSRPETLFEISDTDDKMYIRILREFEMIAIRNVEKLVKKLCAIHNISCKLNNRNIIPFDMLVNIDGKEKYVEFKSSFQAFNLSSLQHLANN